MHETTTNDLFYNLDDIRNLFFKADCDKFYKGYKINRQLSLWSHEPCPQVVYFKKLIKS